MEPRRVASLAISILFAACSNTQGASPGSSGGAGGSDTNRTSTVGGTGSGEGGGLFSPGAGACSAGAKTTVSGTIYDPKGDVPLYNVVVYVPSAPLDPLPEGASCDQCGATPSGAPITSALTDTKGHFVLENVPDGADVPLVIQVGKWRRQISLPTVEKCVDNPYEDPSIMRLPRNQAEGHLPRIALSTGGADPLECLLRKIGIDDAEFTPEGGKGRVNLFAGSGGASKYLASLNDGASFTSSMQLWGDVAALAKYDVVLLACEGSQNPGTKPKEALQAMFDYTAQGGRVFASHWGNVWLEQGPLPFPETATFKHTFDLPDPFTAEIDTSFPKGQALSDWLVNVGGSTTPGQIEIEEAKHTVNAVNAAMSRQWIYSTTPESVQYFTFNTPIGVAEDQQCGRVVFSDIHVSSGDTVGADFPSGCTTTGLTPQEKALLFMLFDLSACIMNDGDMPAPPAK